MRLGRLTIVAGTVNLLVLLLAMVQARSMAAQSAPATLRGGALELVDERGVVRVRLAVKGGPQGPVELDLFDQRGIIRVKLSAGEDGSGLLLSEGGASASRGYVQMLARQTGTPDRPTTTSITLLTADGRQRVIKP